MDQRSIGLVVIGLGVLAVIVGGLIALGLLGWFGRLPGDLNIQRDGLRIFVPITSMLLLSAIVSAAIYVIRRLL